MDATGPQGLSEAEKAIWNAISDSEEGKGGDEKAGKSEQSGKSKKRPYAGMERVGVGVGVSKRCKGGKNRSGKWGGGEREGEISRVIKTLIKEGIFSMLHRRMCKRACSVHPPMPLLPFLCSFLYVSLPLFHTPSPSLFPPHYTRSV
eukprot:795114-Amorphochlora_amoeboformis.AAC.1